ncbi:MAG TPA: hypothetical protein VNX88_02815 [Terriglobales bacterium]|jgi:hypothetical protein|nr:hypothetical protein [Terriglobales bacterium]
MAILFLSTGALAVMLLMLWIVRGGATRPSSGEQTSARFYPVDLVAFRNLLSQDEEDFLRSALTTSNYHRVRRARLRAVQEYLLWIAANCATLVALLRVRTTDSELASTPDTEGLVQNALKLRVISLGFWVLLWIEFLLPGIEVRPAAAIRRYEDVWRFAESYFRAHLFEPKVLAGEAVG